MFDHILTAYLHEPWAIRPEKHAALGRVLEPHLRGEALPSADTLRA
jgi:hypothetical protein